MALRLVAQHVGVAAVHVLLQLVQVVVGLRLGGFARSIGGFHSLNIKQHEWSCDLGSRVWDLRV